MYKWEQSLTRWLLLTFAALVLAACGGSGGSGTVLNATPVQTTPVSTTSADNLAVTVGSASLGTGSSTSVKAVLTSSKGLPIANAKITFGFASSGGAAYATLGATSATTDSSGSATVTMTGTADGSGNVTANYTDASGGIAAATAPFVVADGNNITLSSASSSVNSGLGNNDVALSAAVTDSHGGAIPGQTVLFSVAAADGSFTGTSTQLTNSSGVATNTFVPSTTDRSNKAVTITASTTSASGITSVSTTVINIVGTNIQLTSPQTNLTVGATATVTATLLDGNGAAIANQNMTFVSAGLATSPATATTNSSGQATVTITAPNASSVSVVASADGATSQPLTFNISTTTFNVTVATPIPEGGGCTIGASGTISALAYGYPTNCTALPTGAEPVTLNYSNAAGTANGTTVYFTTTLGYFFTPDGSGGYNTSSTATATVASNTASVYFASRYAGQVSIEATTADGSQSSTVAATVLAGAPTQINVQSVQSVLPTTGQTQVIATVRDSIGNPVSGLLVAFTKLADDSQGSLSASSATTNAAGQASVTFTAGALSGATNGVQIQAELPATPSLNSVVALTVGSQAQFISIGTGNVLSTLDSVTYAQPFNVIVTNAAGQPVPNQLVNLKVYPVAYYKGQYCINASDDWQTCASNTSSTLTAPISCPNEDLNLNGLVDYAENNGKGYGVDVIVPSIYPGAEKSSATDTSGYDPIDNADGILQPGNPITLSSGTVTTDSSGEATFNVIYARSWGNWLTVKLAASTQVAGSQNVTSYVFDTSILKADASVANGPPPGNANLNGPFGIAQDCTNPN